ncbi:hypothetical protein A3K73_07165 [Candidatus Pacearchaeota archaeon RBG_13_36_9]|nr:MAG: hypothetical protein A3K73_07165 [Candidatus Pacearchaeota archaeon RBG_13_36_9]
MVIIQCTHPFYEPKKCDQHPKRLAAYLHIKERGPEEAAITAFLNREMRQPFEQSSYEACVGVVCSPFYVQTFVPLCDLMDKIKGFDGTVYPLSGDKLGSRRNIFIHTWQLAFTEGQLVKSLGGEFKDTFMEGIDSGFISLEEAFHAAFNVYAAGYDFNAFLRETKEDIILQRFESAYNGLIKVLQTEEEGHPA